MGNARDSPNLPAAEPDKGVIAMRGAPGIEEVLHPLFCPTEYPFRT